MALTVITFVIYFQTMYIQTQSPIKSYKFLHWLRLFFFSFISKQTAIPTANYIHLSSRKGRFLSMVKFSSFVRIVISYDEMLQ